jgi:hypothetical protein
MYVGGAVVAGACLAAWACSSGPSTAVLYLVVRGQGQVAVTRASNPEACAGNSCSSGDNDGGALELPYAANSVLGLVAQPSAGWQFGSWQVTIAGSGSSPTTSTTPSLVIANAGDGISVLATFDEGGAPESPSSDAGTDAQPAGEAGF